MSNFVANEDDLIVGQGDGPSLPREIAVMDEIRTHLQNAVSIHRGHMNGSVRTSPKSQQQLMQHIAAAARLAGAPSEPDEEDAEASWLIDATTALTPKADE